MATRRQPIDQRIRESVRDHMDRLAHTADVDEILGWQTTRMSSGVELHAGEFTRREAIGSIEYLGRNQGRARGVIEAMIEDDEIEVVRLVPKGRARPWRILRRASDSTRARARFAQPETGPAPRWLTDLLDRDDVPRWHILDIVEQILDPRPVSLVKADQWADWRSAKAEEDPGEDDELSLRERRRRNDLSRARMWWPDLPDDTPQRLLNILEHEPPEWMNDRSDQVARWRRRRTDAGMEGRLYDRRTGGHH